MTFDELYDAGKTELQSRAAQYSDFSPGSVADALVGVGAVLADENTRVIVGRFRGMFLDTAEGQDLDDLAWDRYRMLRNGATPSIGSVTLGRGSASGAQTIAAGSIVRAEDEDGVIEFELDDSVTLGALAASVSAAVTCTATGRRGNVAAGTIVTRGTGVPSGMTVTNAARMAGGGDVESDAAFRERVRQYLPTLRRGTVAALEQGALGVDGVSGVTVDESDMDEDDGGLVRVYVADVEGAGNAELATSVQTELEAWRCAGVRLVVQGASRYEVTMALTVRGVPGTDVGELEERLRAAVAAYSDALRPSRTHYADAVEHVCHKADEARVVSVVQATPSGRSTSPTYPYQSIRFPDGSLTFAFVEDL
jgi:uncharacterized phage protein gp47/JayE